MSEQAPRRRALIVGDFTDAGTGESFTAGAEPMLDAGAFANYEAAGLVTAPAARAPAKPRVTAKPRRKSSPKAVPAAPAVSAAPAAPVDDGPTPLASDPAA